MSNPYLDLQNEVAALLATSDYLADIPIITEEKGDVIKRLDQSLMKGGLKENADGKIGCAMIVHTPTGLGQGGARSVSNEQVKVRVEIYIKLLLNKSSSGLQKEPLTIVHEVKQAMQSWNRGPGQSPVEYLNFDTLESTAQEVSYYLDFAVPVILSF